MQRLAHLQPEMKKLQEKYKNDKERLNQEMMKFYRENKVNPFASCLPMVAQLPVFLSLYYMLRTDLRHDICPDDQPGRASPNPMPCGRRGESQFLFIPDLTDKATGACWSSLIVLYVGSQLVLDAADVDDDGQDAAHDLPGAAVLLRHLRDPVPGRPARLLDHDEPLDDRAAGDRPEAPRPAATTGRGRGEAPLGGCCGGGCAVAAVATAARRAANGGSARAQAARRVEPRRRRAQPKARPAGPPPAPPRKKKKRRGGADERSGDRADRVRELLEHVSEALGLDADVEIVEDEGRDPRDASTATTSGCSSAATARRSTPCSTSPSRSPTATAARDAGRARRSSTPPATASAASRRCSARPTRRPATRCAPAAPSRWTR